MRLSFFNFYTYNFPFPIFTVNVLYPSGYVYNFLSYLLDIIVIFPGNSTGLCSNCMFLFHEIYGLYSFVFSLFRGKCHRCYFLLYESLLILLFKIMWILVFLV